MSRRSVTVIVAVLLSILFVMPVFFSPKPLNDGEKAVNQKTRALETYETEHYRVLYQPGKEFFARWVSNYAEEIYDDAVAFANYTPTSSISIQIEEAGQFECWLNTGDSSGMNIAFQSEWLIDWNDGFSMELKRIIAHELNHVLLSRRLNVAYMGYSGLPWWFYDGLADYYADKFSDPSLEETYKIRLEYYLELDQFKDFNEMIPWDGKSGLFGYTEGYFVFKYIEWTYGTDKAWEFADKTVANGSTGGGFVQCFNMTQSEFESEWRDWIFNNYTQTYHYEATFYGEQITNGTASEYSHKFLSSWHGNDVLYVSDEDGDMDVFLLNLTTSEITKLTDNWITDSDPVFSHSSSKILFTSAAGDNLGVYVMDADGSNITSVVTDEHVNIAAGWHPDDDKILFVSSRSGNYDIYAANLDGTEVTHITTDAASDGDPRYSDDGEKIAFVSNRSGNFELFIMNADGTGVQQLTDMPGWDVGNPYWPPGEDFVLFEAKCPWWNSSIHKLHLENMTTERILGPLPNNTATNVHNPVWSEDGSEILFVVYGEIYRYRLFEPSEDKDIWMPLMIIVILVLIGGSILMLRRKKRQDDVDDESILEDENEDSIPQQSGHGSSESSDEHPAPETRAAARSREPERPN